VRVHSVHAMNIETAPGGRRPLDQANRLEPQARLYRRPVNRIYHRQLDMRALTALSCTEVKFSKDIENVLGTLMVSNISMGTHDE